MGGVLASGMTHPSPHTAIQRFTPFPLESTSLLETLALEP